ncbi:hypothetical protein EMA8858_02078 [Emticicia aquatica]|uniref:Caspase family p20 domain-containing protein n=1 Tax=Emticicia aquatica TaxID=1681835 RepID=A0ABM9AQC0_9BACT|nr:caspase family protein [Emticicia aquatica]CAH0995950.1 hypothetical protein EMA8858_02078 [Emticicia aquatica]
MKNIFYILISFLLSLASYAQETNYYTKGVEYYNNADYATAISQFDMAIARNYTKIYDVYTYRGLSKYRLKNYEESFKDYQQAITELNKLGYNSVDKMPEAIVKAYGTSLYDRGLVQYYRGQYSDAIKDMNYALLYRFNPGLCYLQIANANYALADYSKAIDNYTTAMGYSPKDYSLYYWRGAAYTGLEKWQQSVLDYDRYLTNYPNDAYGYHYRAYAKIMTGNIKEAISDVTKSIDLKIKDLSLPYRNLGLIYSKLDDCNSSIESYKTALSINPNDNFSKQNLAYISNKCNNTTQNPTNNVVKVAAPSISWIYPKEESVETSENVFTVKACVNSSEKPDMQLYVQGIDVASRDFVIVPTKQPDCPYRFEKQVTLPTNASSVSLKFIAKNSGGSSESKRTVYKTKSSNPMAVEKRIALLIGNANYKVKPLSNTLNDIDDMAAKLESMNFKVVKYKNLTYESMSLAFIKFGKELADYDVGMFFYAGHGLQNGSGTNYLVPVDAEPIRTEQDFNKYCVEVDDLFGQMKKANSKVNIIILDACRDNPLDTRSFTRGTGTRGLSAPMERPQGSFVFYAAQANQTALEGNGERNGVFTGELLKVIDKPNLKLEDVVKETSKAVRQKTNDQQKPSWYSEFDGDFYFKH